MLNKNPDCANDEIDNIFVDPINSILCQNAFAKETIIKKIIQHYSIPIIYLDFDLLYSGYMKAGIIKHEKNVIIFSPKRKDWSKILSKILIKISNENCVLVIDSLNSFFSIFDDKDDNRYTNACIMILASFVKNSSFSKNKMFLTSIARPKNGRWTLFPIGTRPILENPLATKFFVDDTNQIKKVDEPG